MKFRWPKPKPTTLAELRERARREALAIEISTGKPTTPLLIHHRGVKVPSPWIGLMVAEMEGRIVHFGCGIDADESCPVIVGFRESGEPCADADGMIWTCRFDGNASDLLDMRKEDLSEIASRCMRWLVSQEEPKS